MYDKLQNNSSKYSDSLESGAVTMAVQDKLYTVQDLLNMPDDGKIYELHNGVLVEVPGSRVQQAQLAMWIGHLLLIFIDQQGLGGIVIGPDGTAELNEFNTRIPDVSYISRERAQKQDKHSYLDGAPDLAVEVVSPSNSAPEMQQRAGEYLGFGARLVWIVNGEKRTIDVYRSDGTRTVLTAKDVLDGGDVLPGLQLPVQRIFERI
jgi:Uma2 family endonuclease